MTRSYHMCLDLCGALLNWSDRMFHGVITDDNGLALSSRDARLALMDELAKGHRVIPCSPCDDFDYQTGCRGQETAEG